MPTIPLPQDPNLEQLRKQAREFQRAVRAGDDEARALAVEFEPDAPPAFPLRSAQLVLARRYGFASWARLRHHVDIVTARTWNPAAVASDAETPPDRFLRMVCLTYSGDPRADLAAAAQLLHEHPELSAQTIATAAACADVEQVQRFLAADPAAAAAPTGPYGWAPLLYQAYARPQPEPGLDATLDTARLLLDSGADPNDGRLWHGLPTPFTVLTGVLGNGEADQPAHPHAIAFGRVVAPGRR